MTTPDPVPAGPDTTGPETPPPAPTHRWVRFIGHAEVIVGEVGLWVEGEAKHVEGWLAERLLNRPDFVETEPPAPEPPAPEPAPESQATGGVIAEAGEQTGDNVPAVLSGGDSTLPADTAEGDAADEAPEPPAKPAGRKRAN